MSNQAQPSGSPASQTPAPQGNQGKRPLGWKKISAVIGVVVVVIAVLANLSTIADFVDTHVLGNKKPAASASTAPSPSFGTGNQTITDGTDPGGCISDARHAHEQSVVTLNGAQTIGKLQLMQSVLCKAMWGRLEFVGSQPSGGWDVTVTLTRQSDAHQQSWHAKMNTTAIFTNALVDNGACFTVKATIGTPDGVVNAETPCTR